MRDIRRIEDDLLSTDNDDEEMRLLLLQRKRDHLVRGLILDVHLQIDDLLSVALRNAILAGRSRRTTMRKEVEGSRSLRFRRRSCWRAPLAGFRPSGRVNCKTSTMCAMRVGMVGNYRSSKGEA